MLQFEDYKAVLDEGTELMKATNHPTLAIELKILNNELMRLKNSRGINKEIAKTTCEYYANEVQRTIQLVIA